MVCIIVSLQFGSGKKLEKWFDPQVEGSIQKEALTDAKRNPKFFFGVSLKGLNTINDL